MPTTNLVLALNSGSSSLKITLYSRRPSNPDSGSDPEANANPQRIDLILNASISNITAPPAKFKFKLESPKPSSSDSEARAGKGNVELEESVDSINDHATAFAHFLQRLKEHASIQPEDVAYICHRVVHGGSYSKPVVIDKESYEEIEQLSDLAPLHNGAALSVIQACLDKMPNSTSIAYFDTTFHRSLPPHVATYPIDQEIAKRKGLKKYGFHGLSYAYILRSVSQHLKRPASSLNLIVLHLGSGASACAIKAGQSLDTSMGLTPLNGLPGATRSGAIDPSLIFHYTSRSESKNLGRMTHAETGSSKVDVTLAEDILNRRSGWKVLTGTTDFGVITKKAELESDDPTIAERNPCRLAFDMFVDRILNYVGSYYLKLEGEVDALVFAGGIGEKSVEVREKVAERVRTVGFQLLDKRRNVGVSEGEAGEDVVAKISVDGTERSVPGAGGRKKEILVCRTDEQFEMANDCASDESRW